MKEETLQILEGSVLPCGRELSLGLTLTVVLAFFALFSLSLAPSVHGAGDSSFFVTVPAMGQGRVLKPYYGFMSFKPIVTTLDDPRGIACGPEGLLYIAESAKHKIIRITQGGKYEEVVLGKGVRSRFDGRPLQLAFNDGGDLFFTTPKEGIWKIADGDPRNEAERLIKGSFFDHDEWPQDLAFLQTGEYKGDMIVSVLTERPRLGYVVRIPGPDYNQVRPFISSYFVEEMGTKRREHLKVPIALAVNKTGQIFVADPTREEHHILRYMPDGSFSDVFVEKVNDPIDLNVDSQGRLYATLGSLDKRPDWEEDRAEEKEYAYLYPSSGGALKIYGSDGGQLNFIPRSGLWGVAVCE